MKQWLTKVGAWRVEHYPLPYFHAPIDLAAPRKGVLHTTEGSTLEGALSAYRSKGFCPNFTLGKDARGKTRVLQHKPLGIMGSTLANPSGGVDTNRLVMAQIELVGFSKKDLWYPEKDDADALTALMGALCIEAKIPLQWQLVRRDPRLWTRVQGWCGHIDVPENYHWDPGQLDHKRLMVKVREKIAFPTGRKTPRKLDKVRTLPLKRRAKKAQPEACGGGGGPVRSQ